MVGMIGRVVDGLGKLKMRGSRMWMDLFDCYARQGRLARWNRDPLLTSLLPRRKTRSKSINFSALAFSVFSTEWLHANAATFECECDASNQILSPGCGPQGRNNRCSPNNRSEILTVKNRLLRQQRQLPATVAQPLLPPPDTLVRNLEESKTRKQTKRPKHGRFH
jgi:hypothetical protein